MAAAAAAAAAVAEDAAGVAPPPPPPRRRTTKAEIGRQAAGAGPVRGRGQVRGRSLWVGRGFRGRVPFLKLSGRRFENEQTKIKNKDNNVFGKTLLMMNQQRNTMRPTLPHPTH